MLSLRGFHLLFIIVVIVAADMFGAWGVYTHTQTGEDAALYVGILSFLGSFALIAYAIWLVRKLDRAHVG
ncbi:MAG: hypothetical protein AABZ12_11585 [Planctomycetota bacterium]